ncbi:MAG TPA: hypothetical protein VFW85_03530 [Gaiellaceae bacterium]|nr:hypothetical protein [Gaiellaceae bacterium]
MILVTRLAALLALAGAVLAVAGGAAAGPLTYGVSDDWPLYHPCGDVFWKSMSDAGLSELRLTVQWDGTRTISPAGLQAAADCARLQNVTPVLAIFPTRPTLIGSSDSAQSAFASFVALVGQAFPQVRNFIVGNEPNVNRFWQPQFVGGQDAAARDYEHTLAKSYDALKMVRPDSIVWGPAISSRGNDNATATTNPSHSPVRFITEMGAVYRASGRTRPIFDEYDMHPYPPTANTDPYTKMSQWPNAGAANLDRIKQALWDGFHGTAQPVPSEQSGGKLAHSRRYAGGGLPINLDEVGTQTPITGHEAAYSDPPDNVPLASLAAQADYYTNLMELAACDPDVKSLLFFPLLDNTEIRSGFQSGLLFADGVGKPAYLAVKRKISSSHGACQGGIRGIGRTWQHTTQVVGALAKFGSGIRPSASEDVTYKAAIFPASGSTTTTLSRALASAKLRADATTAGSFRAYYHPAVTFGGAVLPPGKYVYAIRMTSQVNPSRTTTFVSKPFSAGSGGSSATGGTGKGQGHQGGKGQNQGGGKGHSQGHKNKKK